MRRVHRHDRPSEYKLRHLLKLARDLVRESPDGPNASHQRGFIEALTWALGENRTLDRSAKRARSKARKAK